MTHYIGLYMTPDPESEAQKIHVDRLDHSRPATNRFPNSPTLQAVRIRTTQGNWGRRPHPETPALLSLNSKVTIETIVQVVVIIK